MREHPSWGRLVVGLTVVGLLAGCGTAANPSPVPASPSPAGTPAPASPSLASSPAPTLAVDVTKDVTYESTNPVSTPGILDVYAPAEAGRRPVVVMLHGGGNDKGELSEHARSVASLGFVVFSVTWGAGYTLPETYAQTLPVTSQVACAVEFARARAADYGGDPATMIVFGHSFGANFGSMVAFARTGPSAGCLARSALGAIDALVTWDGDWLLQPPTSLEHWDQSLAADPKLMDGLTPWKHLAEHKDLKVVMLVSEIPKSDVEIDRPLPDPAATDAFFAPRDPSGVLRRQLEASGALADGNLDIAETQQLMFSVLKAQGNPVSLDVLPDSNHLHLGDAGWKVFLAAFPKAAQN